MNEEEYEDTKYDVDVKKSLIANTGFFVFILLILIFYFKTMALIVTMEDSNTQLIAILAFLFCIVKLLQRRRYPSVYFKEKIVREKKK